VWVKGNWRFVASVAAIAVTFGFGYYKGYSHEHTNFQNHLNDDRTAMAVAKAENERKERQQKEITDIIVKEYADAVDKLNDYYKSHPRVISLCHKSSTANTVPTKGQGTSGVDKAINRITETPTPIEIDLLIAGKEVEQCRALIKWELEQEKVQ
jgi:hypothetical protein